MVTIKRLLVARAQEVPRSRPAYPEIVTEFGRYARRLHAVPVAVVAVSCGGVMSRYIPRTCDRRADIFRLTPNEDWQTNNKLAKSDAADRIQVEKVLWQVLARKTNDLNHTRGRSTAPPVQASTINTFPLMLFQTRLQRIFLSAEGYKLRKVHVLIAVNTVPSRYIFGVLQ